MDAILIAVMFVGSLLAALAALVHFARHDTFAGPGTHHRPADERATFPHRRAA